METTPQVVIDMDTTHHHSGRVTPNPILSLFQPQYLTNTGGQRHSATRDTTNEDNSPFNTVKPKPSSNSFTQYTPRDSAGYLRKEARWIPRQAQDGLPELAVDPTYPTGGSPPPSCEKLPFSMKQFQGRIPDKAMDCGHYNAVLCITTPKEGTIDSIFVEYDFQDNKTRMLISKDQVQELSRMGKVATQDTVRVLLHRQVAIERGKDFNLKIKVKGTNDTGEAEIGLVYFELSTPTLQESTDYTAGWIAAPLATLDFATLDPSMTAKIEKFALSGTGTVLALLSSSLEPQAVPPTTTPPSNDCAKLHLSIYKRKEGACSPMWVLVKTGLTPFIPKSLLAPTSSSTHPQVVVSHDGSRVIHYDVLKPNKNQSNEKRAYFQMYCADVKGGFGPASYLELPGLPPTFSGHGRFIIMQDLTSDLTEYFLVSDGVVVYLYRVPKEDQTEWILERRAALDVEDVQDDSVMDPKLRALSFIKRSTTFGLAVKDNACNPLLIHPTGVHHSDETTHESEEVHENIMALTWIAVKSACPTGYIAWSKGADAVVIYDLIKDRFLMRVPRGESPLLGVRFSSDGSLTLLSFEDSVVLFRTEGGRRIGKFDQRTTSGWGAEFLHNDTQIMSGGGFILDVRTMKPLGTYFQSRASSDLDYSPIGEDRSEALTAHGSKLDWMSMNSVMVSSIGVPKSICEGRCHSGHPQPDDFKTSKTEYVLSPGAKYRIDLLGTGSVNVTISLIRDELPDLVVLRLNPTTTKQLPNNWAQLDAAYFLQHSPHLVLAWSSSFQVWCLPQKAEGKWDLVLYWNIWGSRTMSVSYCCPHENTLTAKIAELSEVEAKNAKSVVWNLQHVLDEKTMGEFFKSLGDLPYVYKRAHETYKRAWIRYVGLHINDYPDPTHLEKSVMAHVCSSFEERNDFETIRGFLTDLLEYSPVPWIPRQDYTKESNPLAILIEKSDSQPKMIELIALVVQYCVKRARFERNLEDMAPVLSCMDRLLLDFPDIITAALQDLAYLPIRDRQFVIHNHLLTHSPTRRLFNSKKALALRQKSVNPLLQIKFPPTTRDPLNEKFTGKLFVASFDSLWPQKTVEGQPGADKHGGKGNAFEKFESPSMLKILGFVIKLSVGSKTHKSLPYRDFKLNFYDNPAIEALIQYKWNKFGYLQWLIRFIVQLIFYILIFTATFVQVYGEDANSLFGVFVAIIVMGTFFLILEFLQWTENPKQYIWSPYNWLDIIVFLMPIGASINQIVNINRQDVHGNKSLLSFTVVFIFLHLISELRINQSVCKYVTIVLRVLREIKVFFLVFAMGILTFSTSTVHLIHGCPTNGCLRQELQEGQDGQEGTIFPRNFWHAISSVYFIMGGRYEPVGEHLDGDAWDIQIMMMIYFFFTVIIMLNVLIALINVAFNEGDDNWRLVWLENRLRYVESAEKMSSNIPGLRESTGWFPREIFYTATQAQEDDYRKRHPLSQGVPPLASASPIKGVSAPKEVAPTAAAAVVAGVEVVQDVQKEMQDLKTEMREMHSLLKILSEQLARAQQQ